MASVSLANSNLPTRLPAFRHSNPLETKKTRRKRNTMVLGDRPLLLVLMLLVVAASSFFGIYSFHSKCDAPASLTDKEEVGTTASARTVAKQDDLIVFFSFQKAGVNGTKIRGDELIAFTYARYANPEARIILMIDEVSRVVGSDAALLSSLHIQVSKMPFDSRIERFDQVYKHASVNKPDYESMCFKRFIYLDRLVREQDGTIASVTMPDSDIVLLSQDAIPFLPPGVQAWRHSRYASFLMRFTPAALTNFSDSILSFYAREPHLIVQDVQKYGGGPQIPQTTIQAWMPAYNNAPALYQFSDMHYQYAWFGEEELQRKTQFLPGQSVEIEDKVFGNFRTSFTPEQNPCEYPRGALFHLQWNVLRQSSESVQYAVTLPNRSSAAPVPGIHFQGNCKQVMCLGLCSHLLPWHRTMVACCSEPELDGQRAKAFRENSV